MSAENFKCGGDFFLGRHYTEGKRKGFSDGSMVNKNFTAVRKFALCSNPIKVNTRRQMPDLDQCFRTRAGLLVYFLTDGIEQIKHDTAG